MTYNTCRLCKDDNLNRELFRYGIRHYCHAECGFQRWGDDFLRKIPTHEIGRISYRLMTAVCAEILRLLVAPDSDDYVAWLRYKHNGDEVTIHVCDSDTPGAFKAYKR